MKTETKSVLKSQKENETQNASDPSDTGTDEEKEEYINPAFADLKKYL